MLVENQQYKISRTFVQLSELKVKVSETITQMQNHLLDRAKENLKSNIIEATNWDEFMNGINDRKIVYAPFCDDAVCEEEIKDKTKGGNSRCFPFDQKEIDAKCIHCGKPAKKYAYFGKNY